MPLPAARALLGHASVQTTAGYSKTNLSQLCTFVDVTFAPLNQAGGPSPNDRQESWCYAHAGAVSGDCASLRRNA